MWTRIKAAPAWLWAVAVGVALGVWLVWQRSQTSTRIAAIETRRRRVETEFAEQILSIDVGADAQRELVLDAARASHERAERERAYVRDAAAGDQAAFAAHWAKVMGR